MSQLPIDPTALSTAIATAMQNLGGDGDFQFMKMTKAGEFMFGADETEVQEGSQWAIDPRSITKGFIKWVDSELEGEEMAQVFGGQPIIKSNLPDSGVGWSEHWPAPMATTKASSVYTSQTLKAG